MKTPEYRVVSQPNDGSGRTVLPIFGSHKRAMFHFERVQRSPGIYRLLDINNKIILEEEVF